MSVSGRILNEMCSSRICVDEYHEGEIRGRIYNNYYAEPIVFENAIQFLKKMEALFDGFEYPQKTLKTRSFRRSGEEKLIGQMALSEPQPQDARGRKATFHVKVVFRKNATWQGNILWVDQKKEESFRSALELLELMDSAL